MFLWDFEALAFERIQVLKILEQATKQAHKVHSIEWRKAVLKFLREHKILRYVKLIESSGSDQADVDQQTRHEDVVAHFTLRFAYCRTRELQDWFIQRELELFKLRYDSLSSDGVESFMKTTAFNLPAISDEVKNKVMSGLIQSTLGYTAEEIRDSDFCKVPFNKAFSLIKSMSVYVREGYAYVPRKELVFCVMSSYEENLNAGLRLAKIRLPSMKDDRVTALLNQLNVSSCLSHTSSTETFTAESLPELLQSFPPCMKSLYDIIKEKHHLKHHGRLQMNWFLKAIGLPLEEAIKYWRGEFCQLIDEDTFNKNYLYYIKHAYGTVGGKFNYKPLDCNQIISASTGPGEYHSCPFKMWDTETLREVMLEFGISQEGSSEIADSASEGNYQEACAQCFKHLHNGRSSKDAIISHPNEYFAESREILTDPFTDPDPDNGVDE
ncbi:DNA primase subunit 2 [Carabus blaptoides fortunei]